MTHGHSISVITRLILSFCLGGILLSVGLGLIEYRHTVKSTEAVAAPRLVVQAQNLNKILLPLIQQGNERAVHSAMNLFANDPDFSAIRLKNSTGQIITTGIWSKTKIDPVVYRIQSTAEAPRFQLDIHQPTLLESSLQIGEDQYQLQMQVSTIQLLENARKQTMDHVGMQWLLLAIMTFCGLLFLRHWFSEPLKKINQLVETDHNSSSFTQKSLEIGGEFGELASSIGGMLRRIDEVTAELKQREQALENLFQFAPVAILSIESDGKITDANQRAADLFGFKTSHFLIDRAILDYIAPKDRARFRQSVDRLELNRTLHSELQIVVDQEYRDVAMELGSLHDDCGNLTELRLSLTDISKSKQLMHQIADQRQLLDMVINHMSDAILLIDSDGKILTANAKLGQLLKLSSESLIDQSCESHDLWAAMDFKDMDHALSRLEKIQQDIDDISNEQFDTQDGAFNFNVMPVCDETGSSIAQLWVVQEVTAQVRNRKLLEQQSSQLRALQQMGKQLHIFGGVDELIERVTCELFRIMDVEAVGIILRDRDPEKRSRQIIHTGQPTMALTPFCHTAKAIQCDLLPKVLSDKATCYWSDIHQYGQWTKPFVAVGFDSIAATALYSHDQAQGSIWVARKGGKHIERHHLYLLEALAPMVSTAIDNAQLRDHLINLQLTDSLTALPSYQQFELVTRHLGSNPTHPFSILMVESDQYHQVLTEQGKEKADLLLRHTANILRDCCRSTDMPFHYNNHQFAVLSYVKSSEDATELAKRINQRFHELETDMGSADDSHPSCSIGIATHAIDDIDADILIHIAMQRLCNDHTTSNKIVSTSHAMTKAG